MDAGADLNFVADINISMDLCAFPGGNLFVCFAGAEGKKVRDSVRKLALQVDEDSFDDDLEMVRFSSVFVFL